MFFFNDFQVSWTINNRDNKLYDGDNKNTKKIIFNIISVL